MFGTETIRHAAIRMKTTLHGNGNNLQALTSLHYDVMLLRHEIMISLS